jgi:hypothetical protein
VCVFPIVCDLETSKTRPDLGCRATERKVIKIRISSFKTLQNKK